MTATKAPATPAFAGLLRPPAEYNERAAHTVRRLRHRRAELSALKTAPLDLRRANKKQLARLPGIGPARARRIVAFRKQGELLVLEDLLRIDGIGQRTVEGIRPYVTVSVEA